jgi:hypothetical protein
MTISRAGTALALLGVLVHYAAAANAEDRADRVVLRGVPDGGKPVVARTDKAGAIHLLYDSDDGPRYAKSSDGGRTFEAPISVVGEGPRPAGLEYHAWDMAVGKGGRVQVAMGTNAWKLKLPQEEWGYFHASLDPGASAFSPVRNINKKPSEGFSIAADDEGNVTACWLSDKLYANVSRDNGETFGPNVELDPGLNPCNCCTTSATYCEDGRLAVLYREETNNERDMYLVRWDQSRDEMERTRVGRAPWTIDACPMTYYTVAPGPGGFVAAWPTKGRVYFARLDGRGEPIGPAEVETPGRSGMRSGVLALSAPDGSTLVTWKAEGRAGWQLYDAEGRPAGEPGSVESPGNGIAGVAGEDGRFILFR